MHQSSNKPTAPEISIDDLLAQISAAEAKAAPRQFDGEVLGTISSVRVVGRRNKRCRVFLDGQELLECNADVVYEFGLGKGTPVTQSLIDAVEAREARLQMRRQALAFIAFKPRTEQQVRKKLRERGYGDDMVAEGIAFLYEFEYLDDRRYAEMFVRDQLRDGKKGIRRIKSDLRARGVPQPICEDVLSELSGEFDTSEHALTAARRKLRSLGHKPREKQLTSLRDWLLRRGFSFDETRNALADLFDEEA